MKEVERRGCHKIQVKISTMEQQGNPTGFGSEGIKLFNKTLRVKSLSGEIPCLPVMAHV